MTYASYRGTFRIDDVSANTNEVHLTAIIRAIRETLPKADVMLAVSPLVHDLTGAPVADRERPFPRMLSPMSDHRVYYKVRRAIDRSNFDLSSPLYKDVIIASHGLIHVDHRLLPRRVQEMSVAVSCSLLDARIFVPPFNHWNDDTDWACAQHGVRLVRFEEGWRHVQFNEFDLECQSYYLHTHDTGADWLREWLRKKMQP